MSLATSLEKACAALIAAGCNRGEPVGVAVVVARDGRAISVGHAAHGVAFDADTPVVLRSVAKFLTSLVVHRLAHEGALSVNVPVFADSASGQLGGGRRATLDDILRQRGELFGLRDAVMPLPATPPSDVLAQLMAQQGSGVGFPQGVSPAYHPVTWGLLVDRCVTRATGTSVVSHFAGVADGLSLPAIARAGPRRGALADFVRVPQTELQRAARRGRATAEVRFLRALRERGSDTWIAYRSLPVADALRGGLARLENVGLSLAGSAREVALWASAAAAGVVCGDLRAHGMGRAVAGYDRVLLRSMAWTSGAMEWPESAGMPRGAIGFVGGGGSLVAAQPSTGVGLAVVSNLVLPAVELDPLLADVVKCAWASVS